MERNHDDGKRAKDDLVAAVGEGLRKRISSATEERAVLDRVWSDVRQRANGTVTSASRRKPPDLNSITLASAFSRKTRVQRKQWAQFAAAAVIVIAAVGTAMLWRPADSALFRVTEGKVYDDDRTIRSNGDGKGVVLSLNDGSRVEMRSQSELALSAPTASAFGSFAAESSSMRRPSGQGISTCRPKT